MPKPQFLLLLIVLCMGFSPGCPDGLELMKIDQRIDELSSKLFTTESRKVIDDHKQIYGMSCIPMSIEMVLKLTRHAPADFYDLQNKWKNKSDGNFSDFDGKTIKGVTFHKQFGQPRDKDFPLEKLFKTIDDELAAGRYVIISLASNTGWHMYVICDKDKDGEFIALSKADAITISNNHVKRTVKEMKGTDILTYEVK